MITLRAETVKDYPEITKVNDISFGRKTEGKLIKTLRKSPKFVEGLSIIAEFDNQIVGHVLFSQVDIESASKTYQTLCLAPMSVLPEFQHKSIGKLLLIYGLQAAKDLDHKSIVVLGHPSYYPKFGFEPASKWNITSPFPAPDEAFMAIELGKNSLATINGKVIFPEAFDDL